LWQVFLSDFQQLHQRCFHIMNQLNTKGLPLPIASYRLGQVLTFSLFLSINSS
jgi:hypothetical protein